MEVFMNKEPCNQCGKLKKALKEALNALHDLDENHPVLTRPDWSKDGPCLWSVLNEAIKE